MSNDNNSVVNNPLFGAMIGQQIGNNAHAEANQIAADTRAEGAKSIAEAGVIIATQLRKDLDRSNEIAWNWKNNSDKLEGELTEERSRIDLLRVELNSISQSEVDLYAAIAGVRGVTRELLEELRKSDPKNPLLDKNIRDKIFAVTYDYLAPKIISKNFKERDENAKHWRDETFGAEGSNKGGPEISKITPNLQVRAEAEVPSHTPDREKLLDLVKRMSATLKNYNPNEAILQDSALLELMNSSK